MTVGRRERKQAETRLALVGALRASLADRALEDVSVRDLADAADVSEATFYNYFPAKVDLAIYFIQLWSIDMAWHARATDPAGPRAAITAIFDATAAQVVVAPRVMGEIIAVQARLVGRAAPPPLVLLDKQLAFPDRPGIEQLDAVGLDGLLPPRLLRARTLGELPLGVDLDAAFLSLVSVFFGVPMILARRAPTQIAAAYRHQLALVWAGLSSPAGEVSP